MELKKIKKFRGHDEMDLYQGELYKGKERIAFFSEDAHGGQMNIVVQTGKEDIFKQFALEGHAIEASTYWDALAQAEIKIGEMLDSFLRKKLEDTELKKGGILFWTTNQNNTESLHRMPCVPYTEQSLLAIKTKYKGNLKEIVQEKRNMPFQLKA